MLRTPLAVALAALLIVPTAARGQAQAPPPAEPPPAVVAPATVPPAPAEPRRRSVVAQLGALRDAGLLEPAAHDRALARYRAAQATLRRLTGRRRAELRAVLRTLDGVARQGRLTSSRVPLAFVTLERNRRWWSTGALLPYGARVVFPGSELVWQSYPGHGIQVQWLATWGRANGLFTGRTYDARLRRLLGEAVGLAATRAGGLAWESWFAFDGGRPPWVSGLSQGTAVQALSRAAVRLHDPALFGTARAGLGIFRTAPPEGIRVATDAGAHYLQYSFAPRLRILNGFVQALNGLHDFAALANDDEGRALFAAGDAELARELPQADTGAWSRYSVGGAESDLGYHRLLRDFLLGLCERTAEAVACDTAARFTADLVQAPVLTLLPPPAPLRAGRPSRVAFTLSKVSVVTLTASRGRRARVTRTARFARGRHAFAVPRLGGAGPLRVALRAVDLAGNAGTAGGTLTLAPGPAPHRP